MTEQKQSLDQRRAKHALQRIKNIKNREKDGTKLQSDYLSYVKALPATILQNGIGQAMATLLAAAKGKGEEDAHYRLYENVQSWLCSNDNKDAPFPKMDLLEAITSNDQRRYLIAQAEAQAYLIWLKKFAAAFLKGQTSSK